MKRKWTKENHSARRGNSPRRNYKPAHQTKWKIRKVGEEWVADSGTGVTAWGDSKEKIQEWLDA